MKKLLLLLLIACMVVACFACGGNSGKGNNGTGNGETEGTGGDSVEKTAWEKLPDMSYGGKDFIFCAKSTYAGNEAVFAEEEATSIIDDSLVRRNAAVSDRYDINFDVLMSANGVSEQVNQMLDILLSGNHEYAVYRLRKLQRY